MCVVLVSFVADVSAVQAMDEAASVVGSFGVGGEVNSGIDERTGMFATQIPLASLPGLLYGQGEEGGVDSVGGFDVGVSYRQEFAVAGTVGNNSPGGHGGDEGSGRFGLGSGWAWNTTFIETDGGVRVFSASGGVFEADASWPSGLARYPLKDLVFSQTSGMLPSRGSLDVPDEIPQADPSRSQGGEISYAYILEYAGGVKDYFNSMGDLIVREGFFGDRVDVLWEPGHRLVGVVDAAGSRLTMVWNDSGLEIISPARSDGAVAKTMLEMSGNNLVSVTNPVGERMKFEYESGVGVGAGLLHTLTSEGEAVTTVSYQQLPDGLSAVDCVRISDSQTGANLSHRQWKRVGEHVASGWPLYENSYALWGSNDGAYRYHTVISDGATDVVSEYNSLALLVSRKTVVSTSRGDVTVRDHALIYDGTQDGGVPDVRTLSAQYNKPVEIRAVVRDAYGGTRMITEGMEYNQFGQIIMHSAVDGSVTQTVYDTLISEGMQLPVGLEMESTITGGDGAVLKTVNTLSSDRKSTVATETFVGTRDVMESQTRIEHDVNSEGFISETRIVATGSSHDDSSGPERVVTRFCRALNANTVTLSQTYAADTAAQSVSSTVMDRMSGLVVSEIDPVGRVALTVYDVAGRPSIYTGFSGLRTTTEYENTVTRVTDPSNITRSEYVNAVGQIVKVTDNIRRVDGVSVPVRDYERVIETRKYEENSSHVTVRDGRGLETVTVTDVFGRPVKITAPNGATQITEYDDVANMVSSGVVTGSQDQGRGSRKHNKLAVEEAQLVSRSLRDSDDRVVRESVIRQDGVKTPESSKTYDGLGRAVNTIEDDVSTSVVFNADGTARKTTLTPLVASSGQQVVAEREHTALGSSVRKTLIREDGQRRAGVSRGVDVAGRTVSETDQAGNTTKYEYTVDGLISGTHNLRTGVIVRNTYDPITREMVLTETFGNDGTVSSTGFEHDPVTGVIIEVYDPSDREKTRIRYGYDLVGNVTDITYPDGKTIHHVFDEYGQKTLTTDVVGNVTQYEYDQYGALSTLRQTAPNGMVIGVVGYEYDGLGRVQKISRGNDVVTVYSYTSANEINTEKTIHGDRVIFNGVYEYDGRENLVRQIQTQTQQPSPDAVDDGSYPLVTTTTVYTYDAYNRLTSSGVYNTTDTSAPPSERIDYEISVSGDVTKETTTTITPDGEKTRVRQFEYNGLGHLIAITADGMKTVQHYDSEGNLLVAADGTRYTYNLRNQPIGEIRADGTTTAIGYWANGQRATIATHKTENRTVTQDRLVLYWDGDTLINDTHIVSDEKAAPENTTVLENTAGYLLGMSRHTRILTNNTKGEDSAESGYYTTDRHGNVTALTDLTGKVTTSYSYTNYGAFVEYRAAASTTGRDRNPFQYAGEYTTETGTQYLGARIYDPVTMRFTTEDSAPLHNLYAYADANPITLSDPSGHDAVSKDHARGSFSGGGILLAVLGFFLSLNSVGASGLTFAALVGVSIDAFITAAVLSHDSGDGFMSNTSAQMLSVLGTGIGVFTLGLGMIAKRVAAGTAKAATGVRPKGVRLLDRNIELDNMASSQSGHTVLSREEERRRAGIALTRKIIERDEKRVGAAEADYNKAGRKAWERERTWDYLDSKYSEVEERIEEETELYNQMVSQNYGHIAERHKEVVQNLKIKLAELNVVRNQAKKKYAKSLRDAANTLDDLKEAKQVRKRSRHVFNTLTSGQG